MNHWVRAYRVIAALLTLAAMGWQLGYLLDNVPDYRVSNFFSFFTILSNLLTVVTLLLCARFGARGFDQLRGAVTLYMTTTGIVYATLLSGIEVDTTVPWTNFVVHQLMPVVVLLDWLFDPPYRRLEFRKVLLWLLFPLLYLPYSLVRGAIVDWYPYPFLDPRRDGGYGRVAMASAVMAVGIFGLAMAIRWVGHVLRERK
ncbi:Pr6Pr family membrane protein [Longispora sp. NPDC051575]|uniref:Pr6Pr family membrane protein n=1 Tax=Longispora sp. NPDC051575 TaxID=3154943 RepID=UPI00341BD7EA